jgi:hypothetical protein
MFLEEKRIATHIVASYKMCRTSVDAAVLVKQRAAALLVAGSSQPAATGSSVAPPPLPVATAGAAAGTVNTVAHPATGLRAAALSAAPPVPAPPVDTVMAEERLPSSSAKIAQELAPVAGGNTGISPVVETIEETTIDRTIVVLESDEEDETLAGSVSPQIVAGETLPQTVEGSGLATPPEVQTARGSALPGVVSAPESSPPGPAQTVGETVPTWGAEALTLTPPPPTVTAVQTVSGSGAPGGSEGPEETGAADQLAHGTTLDRESWALVTMGGPESSRPRAQREEGVTAQGRERLAKVVWRRLRDGKAVFEQDDGLEVDQLEGIEDRLLSVEDFVEKIRDQIEVSVTL